MRVMAVSAAGVRLLYYLDSQACSQMQSGPPGSPALYDPIHRMKGLKCP